MEAGSGKAEDGSWRMEMGRLEDALPAEAFVIDETLAQLIA